MDQYWGQKSSREDFRSTWRKTNEEKEQSSVEAATYHSLVLLFPVQVRKFARLFLYYRSVEIPSFWDSYLGHELHELSHITIATRKKLKESNIFL